MNQSQFKSIIEQILDQTVNEGKYGDFDMKGDQYADDELDETQTIFNFDADNYDAFLIDTLIENYDELDKAKFNATLKKRTKNELNNVFIFASEDNNIELIKLLLAIDKINPNIQDDKAIIRAVGNNNIELIKLLLVENRFNPNAQDNQAIIDAISYNRNDNRIKIIKLLLADERVNPSDQKNKALMFAINNDDVEAVKLLLADERVVPSDQKNNQTIIEAVFDHSNFEVIGLLKDSKIFNLSIGNNQAIIYASVLNHIEIVNLLKIWYIKNKKELPKGIE